MKELVIFTMLLAAVCVGLLIALCVCVRRIIKLQDQNLWTEACMLDHNNEMLQKYFMGISEQIDHLETQIPNHYKNQNGETGILYRKEEPK